MLDDVPSGYAELVDELKRRIRVSQVRAALAVNRELVLLDWQVGRSGRSGRSSRSSRNGRGGERR